MKNKNRQFLTTLWTAYFLFLELSSLGRTSEISPCIIISQEQQPNNETGYQACAPVHEAVFRFLNFFWQNATHDNILAFGTVMIACFTLTLWWSTSRLWKAGEIHSERELRAYVIVKIDDIESQDSPSERTALVLKIINTGKTPAHKLKCISATRLIAHPIDRDFDFSVPNIPDQIAIVLGPGDNTTHDSLADRPLTDSEMGDAMAPIGTSRIYTYGTVFYEDGFGRSRFTNFCYYLEFEPVGASRGKPIDLDSGRFSVTAYAAIYNNDAN